MKKFIALVIAAAMLALVVPVFAAEPMATQARTTVLDLSSTSSNTSNSSQGWSYQPRGDNGNPLLTLNGYGLENAHSAPIKLAKNTHIVVNGDCYIDNAVIGQDYDVISSAVDGYLTIDGSGTLNLYSENYYGSCIEINTGGENDPDLETLTIENITVNCHGRVPTMYTAAANQPCISCCEDVIIRNAVLNTWYGGAGIQTFGYTPIGGVSDATANVILIDNSVVNIQNQVQDNVWGHAKGMFTSFGKITITGNSDVTINAGSKSIYCYHNSFTVESGRVHIESTPLSTADSEALIICNRMDIGSDIEEFYAACTRYQLPKIISTKNDGLSALGEGLEIVLGTFENGNYAGAPDPDNNNRPTLHIRPEGAPVEVLLGDVNCDGVVDFADVSALYAFLANIGTISAQGMLNANVDGNGEVNMADVSALYQMILNN